MIAGAKRRQRSRGGLIGADPKTVAPRGPALVRTQTLPLEPRHAAGLDHPGGSPPSPSTRLPDRQDVFRRIRVALELAPKLPDVGIDRSRHDLRVVPPDFLEEIHARHDLAIVPREREQQVELPRAE